MEPTTKTRVAAFFGSASVTVICLAAFILWQQHFGQSNNDQKFVDIQQQLDSLEKVSYPDFYKATKEFKQFTVTNNLSSYVDTKGIPQGTVDKNIQLNGKIGSGYLLAEAYVDGKKPLTNFDSIYVNLFDNGGHLFRPNSLLTPTTSSGDTLVLFSLNNIPYLKNIPYNPARTPSTSNWLDILNDGEIHNITAFLSSRVGGRLVNIVIAYSCNRDTPNCELSQK
ncbi:MAG: hypothetical protein Q7S29_05435 [Candidatus Peribacter sp.]|nr:hypothetical protein [Candidatus Peribacter sp.]